MFLSLFSHFLIYTIFESILDTPWEEGNLPFSKLLELLALKVYLFTSTHMRPANNQVKLLFFFCKFSLDQNRCFKKHNVGIKADIDLNFFTSKDYEHIQWYPLSTKDSTVTHK